jgi:transcriptional regulator with XRE-family HTH domain
MIKENLIRMRKQKKFSQQDVAEHLKYQPDVVPEKRKR